MIYLNLLQDIYDYKMITLGDEVELVVETNMLRSRYIAKALNGDYGDIYTSMMEAELDEEGIILYKEENLNHPEIDIPEYRRWFIKLVVDFRMVGGFIQKEWNDVFDKVY